MREIAYDAQFFATATDEALLASVYPTWFDGSLQELVLATWPARPVALRQALRTVLRMADGLRRAMPWPGLAQRTALALLDRLPAAERAAALRDLDGSPPGWAWTNYTGVELRRRAGEAEPDDRQRLRDGWVAQLRTGADVEVRSQAALHLGAHGCGEPALREALAQAVAPRERAACLCALALLHAPDVLTPLLALLDDEGDAWSRLAAYTGLARLGDVRAIDRLLDVWLAVHRPELPAFADLPTYTDSFKATHLVGLQALLDRIEAEPKLATAQRVKHYLASRGYVHEPLLSELLARLGAAGEPAALLARANLYLRLVAPHKSARALVEALAGAVHQALPHLGRGEARTRDEKQFVKLTTSA